MSLRRRSALLLCLSGGAAVAMAGSAFAGDVRIHVTGVDRRGGEMRVQICTPQTFLKECPYRAKAPATAGATDVLIPNVPPGTYSVVVHHDINNDAKVNRTLLGVPEEGVGFSRNPMLIMRAPTFDETSVTVGDKLVEVDIGLKFEP